MAAGNGYGKDIGDVAGRGGGDGREDSHPDDLGAEHEEEPGAEQEIPDQAEDSGACHLTQVHAGDSGERQGGEQHLHGLTDLPLGRGDEGEVQVGVVDLHADVQQSSDCGGSAGRAGEGPGVDVHVRLLVRGPRLMPGDDSTVGTGVVARHHHLM
ncbi:hypothetical protein [Cellulomonas sp. WB94]|uniref:hypothetical protein n=1 Tax=Cellulomonas sp. WB94 TaxID=2173174 RepID=UPI001304AD2A|nr:hypothetical protein [Cellulomonas sp. WB94]